MSLLGNLQVTSFTMAPEPWAQFQKLAKSQSLSASALLRQLINKEIRRAKRAARAEQ
jgi:hypothetical protein